MPVCTQAVFVVRKAHVRVRLSLPPKTANTFSMSDVPVPTCGTKFGYDSVSSFHA